MQQEKYIVHIDMDAFFASIEQRDNRLLCGKPVIVGADPKNGKGRGVVSTCSYEARKFGIHSAMPISIAYKKCPQAIFVLPDLDKYSNVSNQIFDILYNFTPDIEPIGIDEAFLDITGSYHLFGTPLNTCKLIKSGIREETGLTASIGLAFTKMVAKIASDIGKPDGLVEVPKEGILDFLWPLDVGKIWGLGKKTKPMLNEMGIKTIGDLAKRSEKELMKILGNNGAYFWRLANGIDDTKIEPNNEHKSISNEFTFDEDISDRQKIESTLLALCEKVSDRLRNEKLKGKTITLKMRFKGFHTYTKSVTIQNETNFFDVIYNAIKKLYARFDMDTLEGTDKKVRLVGVKVSNFVCADFQYSLFKDDIDEKRERLHQAVDKIKEKFGEQSIYRSGIYNKTKMKL